MKSIKNIIKEAIIGQTDRTIEIEDTGFLLELVDPHVEKRHVRKRMFNFMLLMVTMIFSIVCVICSFMFFLNDIILFQNKPTMNYAGAIIPECSCNREYVLFMFNSAERWAETGIQLHEGDRIRISASGCFNSDMKAVTKNAHINNKLRYKWVSTTSHDTLGVRECLYAGYDGCGELAEKGDAAYFGSILFQINSESGCDNNNDYGTIHQIGNCDAKKFIDIRDNGMLYFAVNDIYLSNQIIDSADSANRLLATEDSLLHSGVVPYDYLKSRYMDVISLYYVDQQGNAHIFGDDFKAYFHDNRDAWFHDNLGEILMCVEIERSLNMWSWPSKWYRYTERLIDNAWDYKWYFAAPLTVLYVIWSIVCLTGYVLWFILLVVFKVLIYIIALLLLALLLLFVFRRRQLCSQLAQWRIRIINTLRRR